MSADAAESDVNSPVIKAGWWIRAIRVRLRFLMIVVVAGLIVAQWPVLRGVWDRWTWNTYGKRTLGSVSGSREYFCPMDPGVHSTWPAICPICNMDLVPRNKMDAQMLPDGVIARMQLSPYRIQLAGIRTASVETRPLNTELTLSGVLRKLSDGSLGYEANVSQHDFAMFAEPRMAHVRAPSSSEPVMATVVRGEAGNVPRVQITLENGSTALPGTVVSAQITIPVCERGDVLSVPESAVVDRGRQRLVYVETMPGMFDGVEVELGQRCGSFYPVIKGLNPGQRVASAGAFLIDAETRLNPSLAAGYFGANRSDSPAASPPPVKLAPVTPPPRKSAEPKQPLSREDQDLANKQKICPVTELSLDAMGGPVPVMVEGRKIFICCAGCEQRLKSDPEKYLAKLQRKTSDLP